MSERAQNTTSEEGRALPRSIRMLVVDDSAADAELMISMVRRKGFAVTSDHVDSLDTFYQRLADKDYDVILSDHNLRSWFASDALQALRQSSKDIPFIIVTGTLGDERAVEYLKEGASDYVLKEHLERLPSAILRALQEKAQRNENQRLQQAIRASKDDWERTFDAIPDSIMLLDRECRIVRGNRATAELLSIESAQFTGKHCFTIVHKHSCPPLQCPFRHMLTSGREEHAEVTETELGKILHVSTIPLRDAAGELEGAIHVMRDITERKQLELQLIQAQKLEAIGSLAGGVAHDFNNILGVILGYSQLMQAQIPKHDNVLHSYAVEIGKAAEKGAGVTRQLLTFSRKQVMQFKTVNLNAIVADLATMLRSLIGENIELIVSTADDLGRVKVDPTQMQQILMNLAINARDAMPNGGQLTIATANVGLREDSLRLVPRLDPGSYVMISVADTGIGMDDHTLSHLFEPFFTTKGGKGTGFGLSITYGIVKQSGGDICVSSAAGKGAIFTIYLPRITEPAEKRIEIATAAVDNATSATILLVEDEEALAELTCTVLEYSGYAVLRVQRPEEALRLARSYPGHIDLMLSDVILRAPMNGIELAKEFSTLRPDAKVLLMSGYSDALHRVGADSTLTLLEKPFTNAELRQRVREVLNGVSDQGDQVCPLPKRASATGL